MASAMRTLPLLLLLMALPVQAELADPTRPPAVVMLPGENATQAGVADGVAGLRLQSVLMPQAGRPVAVISGKTVSLGNRIGGATLVRLNEREAVLQGADGMTRLFLTPGVEKTMILTTPGVRQGAKPGPVKGLP